MTEQNHTGDLAQASSVIQLREALEDCKSHREAWRVAIRSMGNSLLSSVDSDDKLYWLHELQAFDRTFAALAAQPPAAPVGTIDSVPSCGLADEHGKTPAAPVETGSDLVSQLRNASPWLGKLAIQAADEIDRLRAYRSSAETSGQEG